MCSEYNIINMTDARKNMISGRNRSPRFGQQNEALWNFDNKPFQDNLDIVINLNILIITALFSLFQIRILFGIFVGWREQNLIF